MLALPRHCRRVMLGDNGASARDVGHDRDQLKGLEYDNNVVSIVQMCCEITVNTVNIALTDRDGRRRRPDRCGGRCGCGRLAGGRGERPNDK